MFEKSKYTIQASIRKRTYRINDDIKTEKKNKKNNNLKINVVFLDDSCHCFELERRAKGFVLLASVFEHLELSEKDYFGLQFDESEDGTGKEDYLVDETYPFNSPCLKWLEPSKQIKKQIRFNSSNHIAKVYFRVKFYIDDPSKLSEEFTSYHVYLQIKKDIDEGRLISPPSTLFLLNSYALQSKLGDFCQTNENEVISLLHLNFKPVDIDKIIKLYKLHKGMLPSNAEYNYIDIARKLEHYGVVLYNVKDKLNKDIQMGISSFGIYIYYNAIKINTFNWSKIIKISFKRNEFYLQLKKEPSEDYDTILIFNCISYNSCKKLWKTSVEFHKFFRLNQVPARSLAKYQLQNSSSSNNNLLHRFSSKFRYSRKTQYETREDKGKNEKYNYLNKNLLKSTRRSKFDENIILIKNRINDKIKSYEETKPKLAWEITKEERDKALAAAASDDLDHGGFLSENNYKKYTNSIITFADDEELKNHHDDEEVQPYDGTIRIKLKPNSIGKFGFNIKGGYDVNSPIIISKVVNNTPADQCYPKLHEGDEILRINDADISKLLHLEVVDMIKNAALNHQLTLTIKQPDYEIQDDEEPKFQYIPDIPNILASTTSIAKTTASSTALLNSSICLLQESIEFNDDIASQFELVHRMKPGLSSNIGRLDANSHKNRYKDIIPYDVTRVILNSPEDYINANHITMEIPNSGILNKYIACQGPLSSTVEAFWQMAWETKTHLIIMLTNVYENGYIKCHQYWPGEINSTLTFNRINIKVVFKNEKPFVNWLERDFEISHLATGEVRLIKQLQYKSWPDHGIPDNHMNFVHFIEKVRALRDGTIEPMIIHCSAGIGRTGVLILMETAECLIEANQPVYPLEIMKQMRNQRPFMIQNIHQYKFVCQCIIKVYQQGIIFPLNEFLLKS